MTRQKPQVTQSRRVQFDGISNRTIYQFHIASLTGRTDNRSPRPSKIQLYLMSGLFRCSCRDFKHRGMGRGNGPNYNRPCKHIILAMRYFYRHWPDLCYVTWYEMSLTHLRGEENFRGRKTPLIAIGGRTI